MSVRGKRQVTIRNAKTTRTLVPEIDGNESTNVMATLVVGDDVESNSTPREVPAIETLDIIDLTQDSPSGQGFRSPRRRSNLSRESADSDIVVVESDFRSTPLRARTAANVIDETICLDDINDQDATSEDSEAPAQMDSFTEKPRILSCPICFEPLKSEVQPMITTCGHMYCKDCLKIVGTNMKKCSICQEPIKLRSCIKVHFT